jgi:hypothetical protein
VLWDFCLELGTPGSRGASTAGSLHRLEGRAVPRWPLPSRVVLHAVDGPCPQLAHLETAPTPSRCHLKRSREISASKTAEARCLPTDVVVSTRRCCRWRRELSTALEMTRGGRCQEGTRLGPGRWTTRSFRSWGGYGRGIVLGQRWCASVARLQRDNPHTARRVAKRADPEPRSISLVLSLSLRPAGALVADIRL